MTQNPKTIQMIMFTNKKTNRSICISKHKAVYIAVDGVYSLIDLGFKQIFLEDRIMKKIIKNVRKGFYPDDVSLATLLQTFHPEELL